MFAMHSTILKRISVSYLALLTLLMHKMNLIWLNIMEFKKSDPVSIVSGRLQFLVKCSKNMDKFIITEISSLFDWPF